MILEYPKVVYKHSSTAVLEFKAKYNEKQRNLFEDKYGKTTYIHSGKLRRTAAIHAKDENGKTVLGRLLREEHVNLFEDYIRLYTRQIGQWNKTCSDANNIAAAAINTLNPPTLRSNNVELSGRAKDRAKSTIWKRNQRLIEAGLILQINHGSSKNYEIILNPYLVHLEDINNPLNFSNTYIDKAFKWHQVVKHNPNTGNLTRYINKIIIEVESRGDNFKPQDTSLVTQVEFSTENTSLQVTIQDTLTGNTGKKAKSDVNSKKKIEKESAKTPVAAKKSDRHPSIDHLLNKIDKKTTENQPPTKTYAQRVKEKTENLQKMRIKSAAFLVLTMIENLLPYWKNNNSYTQKVVDYVADAYFGNHFTDVAINNEFIRLQARLQIAIKHKINKPNYYAPAPMTYFDIRNTKNGFVNTQKMLKTHEKWLDISKKRKYWQTDQQKLYEAVKRYEKAPEIEAKATLERELAYVNTNIPYLKKNFLKMALFPANKQQSPTIN